MVRCLYFAAVCCLLSLFCCCLRSLFCCCLLPVAALLLLLVAFPVFPTIGRGCPTNAAAVASAAAAATATAAAAAAAAVDASVCCIFGCIYRKLEQPRGVIISVGGQTPNNLCNALRSRGVGIMGTYNCSSRCPSFVSLLSVSFSSVFFYLSPSVCLFLMCLFLCLLSPISFCPSPFSLSPFACPFLICPLLSVSFYLSPFICLLRDRRECN